MHRDHSLSPLREQTLPFLLIAPTVAVLLALSIYPLFYALRVSLQTGTGARWTLANFARLARDRFFLDALGHTLVYASVALTLEFLLHTQDNETADNERMNDECGMMNGKKDAPVFNSSFRIHHSSIHLFRPRISVSQ